MHKTIIVLFLLGFSCKMNYKTYDKQHYSEQKLPGIIKLENNIWMDETEVTNFNWCEYMYWTKRMFGVKSAEYKATVPDTNCWTKTDTSYRVFTSHYLQHPTYRDYPIVGITQKQAEDFCHWRSERVFEYILIGSGILKWDTAATPESHFTFERYFNGNYKSIKPDSNHIYYPVYSLPTIKEWKSADKIHDSVRIELIKKTKNKKRRSLNQYNFIHCGLAGVKFRRNSYTNISYTIPVYSGYAPYYQLKGNVSEWTTSPDTTIGGGW